MKSKLVIIAIIILANFLRFYQLGSNPPSLDWDEVSLAYNAYSIIRTGADEYGNTFPLLSIRSFNDYKPPMYVYSLIPSLLIFGKTDFAVRFPSALAGVLTVLVTYFLVKELFSYKLAAVAALLLAVSPWHLQFSRIAFEANLALFFFATGIWLLIRSFRQPPFLPVSAFSFGLSIFTYHSLRIIVPLLVLLILIPRISWLKTNFKSTLLAVLVGLIFLALLGRVISQGAGQARLKTVSIFTIPAIAAIEDNRLRYLAFTRQFLIGYLDHFSPNFWFIDADGNPRHHAAGFGLLYLIEAPFLVLGVIYLLRYHRPVAAILLPWFILAPTASALTSGTPSAVRSLFFLPTFQIFTALGLIYVYQSLKFKKEFVVILLLIFNFSLLTYFDLYYRHTPSETSPGWQYGYKQTVAKVMTIKDKYSKIIVTTEYDQPYIYFLWYGNYDPKIWINDGEFAKRFDKFEFRSISQSDLSLQRSLLIGSPKDISIPDPLWQVNFLDSTPAFVATET